VSDGLIAALLFFVLQAIVALALMGRAKILTANQMWVAFCLAGAATYIVMRLVYWRVRPAGVPSMLDGPVGPALLWGAAGGVAASLAGLAYIEVVAALDLFPAAQRAGVKTTAAPPWLAAVAIVAAPGFEEFIFRGLIFRGLERSFGVTLAAVASAAIFAIVHPPVAVIPVFAMGLVAAAVYHRARMLIAPIVVHALYNAAVIGFQWNAMKWLQ
jgi:membrane protease YdiL (CAAX protease family)